MLNASLYEHLIKLNCFKAGNESREPFNWSRINLQLDGNRCFTQAMLLAIDFM